MSSNSPQHPTQPEWLRFRGKAQIDATSTVLFPRDHPRVAIEMRSSDVQFESARLVYVRRGARALGIRIPKGLSLGTPRQASQHCADGRSRCLGGVEYCCTDEAVGTCNGVWDASS